MKTNQMAKKNAGVIQTAAIVALMSTRAGAATGITETRPNILLIISDEESHLPDSERALINVPNKDWLEKQGVTFSSFFCVTPQCTPARSTIQTGLYPHQTRQVANPNKSYGLPCPKGTEYLAQSLKAQGYRTGYGGKWHLLGTQKDFGIDEVLGDTADDKQEDYLRRFLSKQGAQPWFYQAHFLNPHDIYIFNETYDRKEDAGEYKNESAHYKADADKFLQKNPELPLPAGWDRVIAGLPVPIGAWARPFNGDGRYEQLSRAEKELYWRRYKSLYLTLCEKLDRDIGSLLDVLRKEHPGLLENTIIIYSSDHGDLCGNHEILKFKGPLPFDSQMHIPLIITGPGIPQGEKRDQLVSQVDLASTICDLAGANPPNAGRSDARSFAPVLKERSAPGREYAFCEYYFLGAVQPLRIIRSKDAKLSLHLTENAEVMFDLRNDPNERVNLARNIEYKGLKTTLAAALQAWREQTDDTLMNNQPDYDGCNRKLDK